MGECSNPDLMMLHGQKIHDIKLSREELVDKRIVGHSSGSAFSAAA
jgi:hypothetical protein